MGDCYVLGSVPVPRFLQTSCVQTLQKSFGWDRVKLPRVHTQAKSSHVHTQAKRSHVHVKDPAGQVRSGGLWKHQNNPHALKKQSASLQTAEVEHYAEEEEAISPVQF